jgi:hypothetical protein
MFHADHLLASRMKLRVALMGHKPRIGLLSINHAVDAIGHRELETAVAKASAKLGRLIVMPTPRSAKAFGDGSFLKSVIEWFKSPEGQAVLQALLKIALMFLSMAAELPPDALDVVMDPRTERSIKAMLEELFPPPAKPKPKARSRKK